VRTRTIVLETFTDQAICRRGEEVPTLSTHPNRDHSVPSFSGTRWPNEVDVIAGPRRAPPAAVRRAESLCCVGRAPRWWGLQRWFSSGTGPSAAGCSIRTAQRGWGSGCRTPTPVPSQTTSSAARHEPPQGLGLLQPRCRCEPPPSLLRVRRRRLRRVLLLRAFLRGPVERPPPRHHSFGSLRRHPDARFVT